RHTAPRPTACSWRMLPAGGWHSCPATADGIRSRPIASTTGPTCGPSAHSESGRSSVHARQAASSATSIPATSCCATSSSTATEAVNANAVLEVFQRNAERIQRVVLDMIGRFPADLDALGAREALEPTRGDGHAASSEDVRLFETRLW